MEWQDYGVFTCIDLVGTVVQYFQSRISLLVRGGDRYGREEGENSLWIFKSWTPILKIIGVEVTEFFKLWKSVDMRGEGEYLMKKFPSFLIIWSLKEREKNWKIHAFDPEINLYSKNFDTSWLQRLGHCQSKIIIVTSMKKIN